MAGTDGFFGPPEPDGKKFEGARSRPGTAERVASNPAGAERPWSAAGRDDEEVVEVFG